MAVVTNSNTRIFYAMLGTTIGAIGATSGVEDSEKCTDAISVTSDANDHRIVHGLQSLGVDTNFALEQAFELGRLSLYENIEDIPEISVSMQKFLDGYSLLYHLGASYDGNGAILGPTKTTLSGRADTRADIRSVINATTEDNVTSGDAAVAELYCSGMYLSSVSYTIPTDGTCTEDVGFVGNNKKWINDPDHADGDNLLLANDSGIAAGFGSIFTDDEPAYDNGGKHVLRREDVQTGDDGHQTYKTVVPTIIEGVSQLGSTFKGRAPINAGTINTDDVHINSFSCSTDLGRESINQLGTRTPYNRYVNFPTEVTSELEVTSTAGDNVNAVETTRSNLFNHEICIVLKDSTVIHLGKSNKLSSVSFSGADAGGGNATIGYSFSNFNDLVVLHSGDPIAIATSYWNDQFA